jgi:hypothetical protein
VRDYDHTELNNLPAIAACPSTTAYCPTRNSWGYRVDGGASINLSGVTTAEAYIGYLDQQYESSAYGSISGVDIGASLTWNPSTLTTVKLTTQRTVQDTNNYIVGATSSPGYLDSVVAISLDHELLRDLLLNGTVNYENADFQGISRMDNIYTIGAGAKYLLNRHLYLGMNYSFQHRDSSGAAAINSYDNNILMLRLSTQL